MANKFLFKHLCTGDDARAVGVIRAGGMDQEASTIHSDQSESCTPAVPQDTHTAYDSMC